MSSSKPANAQAQPVLKKYLDLLTEEEHDEAAFGEQDVTGMEKVYGEKKSTIVFCSGSLFSIGKPDEGRVKAAREAFYTDVFTVQVTKGRSAS